MTAISDFFSNLYNKTTVFFTLLLLQFIVLLHSFAYSLCNSGSRQIATNQLLSLIEENNPTVRYQSGLKMEFKDCAVCLSNFRDGEKIRKLQCKHAFHRDCLDRWLQQDYATCPLCRQEVLPEEIAAIYRRRLHNYDRVVYDGSDEELVYFLSAAHGSNFHRPY